jgi:hypothetical protein
MLFLACNGGDPADWITYSKTDMATIYTALHAQEESTLLAINGNEYELTFTYSEAAKKEPYNTYGLDKAKQINRATGFERVVKKFYGTPEGLARAVEDGAEGYVAYMSLEGATPASRPRPAGVQVRRVRSRGRGRVLLPRVRAPASSQKKRPA